MKDFKIKLRMVFRGFDLWIAVGVVVALMVCVVDHTIPNTLAKDLYAIGITIISVIFSVFIAALAIIMSAGSDDFIDFLEEEGHFTLIVWGFKFTMVVLFIALVVSITFYSLTSFWISHGWETQHIGWLAAFAFFATWAILATFLSAVSSITYSQYRIRFIRARTDKPKQR